MNYTTSSNPLLTRAFKAPSLEAEAMTFDGTVTKTLSLFAALLCGAVMAVSLQLGSAVTLAAVIGGLGLVAVTVRNPRAATMTAVPWSFLQGVLLGGVSIALERSTHGIVGLAVGLTAGAFVTMLVAYRSGLIRPSDRFRAGVVGATGAIAFWYVLSFVLELAGVRSLMGVDLRASGLVGIGATVVVLAVAVLNLVLDFDFIEQAVAKGAPRSMEWFAAFSLTVTLLWIYVEFLDLLGGED
jgi:uncharacterized YccA/Bax inhibitor family protein